MAYLSGQGIMMLNLLNDICIDIHRYQPDAGWDVSTNIPDELLDKPMTVQMESWCYDENDDILETTIAIEVNASYFLDDIIAEIVQYIRSLSEDENLYFEDHCFLESLVLDTDTMVATTSWGS